MSTAEATMQDSPAPSAAPSTLPRFVRDPLRDWLDILGKFQLAQRREILKVEPTPEKLAEHRQALKWLLRLTGLLHAEIKDSDFPDKALVKELGGKLWQLEESWSMIQEPMPEAEADAILKRCFPDEA